MGKDEAASSVKMDIWDEGRTPFFSQRHSYGWTPMQACSGRDTGLSAIGLVEMPLKRHTVPFIKVRGTSQWIQATWSNYSLASFVVAWIVVADSASLLHKPRAPACHGGAPWLVEHRLLLALVERVWLVDSNLSCGGDTPEDVRRRTWTVPPAPQAPLGALVWPRSPESARVHTKANSILFEAMGRCPDR